MVHESAESDLIQLARSGDRAALSELLLSYYDELSRFIARRISKDLQCLQRPDDILQQTFVRAARSVENFESRGKGTFLAWLRTIAANLIRDAEKRRVRERRVRDNGLRNATANSESTYAGVIEKVAGNTTSPSARVVRHEGIRRMQVAISCLPPDQREIVQLYYLENRSLGEIAEIVAKSKDAVRGVCYRARKNLRASMGGSSLYF